MQHRSGRTGARLVGAALLAAIAGASPFAKAQSYPAKPVRVIVGLAPGGNPDTLARLAAGSLAATLGGQFVVENRPGAGSNLAADVVAKSAPDGHTILVGSSGLYTINPFIYRNMPFDAFRDLTPVTLAVATTMWLVVHPSVPANNVAEFIALAKASPKPLAYASSGMGSIHHITTEEFKHMAGIDMTHIPFKGAGQTVPALLAGDVPVAFIGYPTIAQAVKAGRLKVLGFSMARRSSLTPEVPTVGESGLPGFDMAGATGVMVAAGTPRTLVNRLNEEFNKLIRAQDVMPKLLAVGMEPIGTTPEQWEKMLRAEHARGAEVVKRLGLKAD